MKDKLNVQGTSISVIQIDDNDYISLTDMIHSKDGNHFISNWLRNRNVLEFISIWESVHNPSFNYVEFDTIKINSGLNSYRVSVKEMTEKANIIGIVSRAGRYGGTYAHKDIAFEFGMWISPEFKVYLIKEYQRLKEKEFEHISWTAKRELAKVNYLIHTDAIRENLIIPELTKAQINYAYASEADMLNVVVFGKTSKQWRNKNKELKGNMRDYASIEQLLILANLESYNAILIESGIEQKERILLHHDTAKRQLKSLNKNSSKLLLEKNKNL